MIWSDGDVEYGQYIEFKPNFLTESLDKISYDVRVAEVGGIGSSDEDEWQKIDSVEWLQFDYLTGTISGNPS